MPKGLTMKRLLRIASAAAITAVTIPLAAGSAHAAPSNSTSITLTCDKAVDAHVSLTLQPSQSDATFLGRVEIACGPGSNVAKARNRVEVPTGALSAGWIIVESWSNSADSAAKLCAVAGAVTYKGECTNDAGIGSQLVVR
jgi:hypothetical protein